ncbi:MAG: 2-dehydro-3-deoxyphosphogluconate aldolase, partial [Bacteroidetes bacterium]
MNVRKEILQRIIASGAVAVVRMADAQRLLRVAEALHEGGITAIEITMTTPNALAVIEEVAGVMGDAVQVGVGSVLSAEVARQAIDAGARYVVSPVFKPEIVA